MPEWFEAFGVPVRLAVEPPELQAGVLALLPPGWSPIEPSSSARSFEVARIAPGSYRFVLDGETRLGHGGPELVLDALDAAIRMHVARNAAGVVFVHAGAVVHRGRAIILPGQSHAGKTTLVRALIEAGADYLSDEYAVLGQDGLVHPYPRRLSVRGSSPADLVEEVDPASLGARVARGPAPIALVVLARHRPDARWQPRRLSAGQGAAMTMSDAVPAHERPAETLRLITLALRDATVLEGERGEAAPVAEALLAELAAT